MITIGRVCVKTAGRDAGKRCVVVEVVDKNYVIIAGETRKRKSNIAHLEPLAQEVNLKAGASDTVIEKALKDAGIALRASKSKHAAARPRRKRKAKSPAPTTLASAQPSPTKKRQAEKQEAK